MLVWLRLWGVLVHLGPHTRVPVAELRGGPHLIGEPLLGPGAIY
jgi:hypothetical protein